MVDVFGNEIIKAYTGGTPVKEIYANGQLVWPTGYYIFWTPMSMSGTFTMEGETYNFEDYSGSFRFSGGVITSSAFQSTSVEWIKTNATLTYHNAFAFCSSLVSAELPNCSAVWTNCFTNCTSLESISLPVCTLIGGNAFESCKFSYLDLPMVETIEGNGFRHCKSLTSVDLPECSSVGQYAFQDCTSLTTISLPVCKEIEQGAFGGDKALESVNLPECTYIGSSAFTYCSSLSTVSLPKVQSMESYAFAYCYSLQSVSLPVCTSVSSFNFRSCSSLSSVYLGDCKSIYGGAFYDCTSLSYLELSGSSMCQLVNTNQFYNTPFANCQGSIVVPTSLYSIYMTDSKWASLSCVLRPSSIRVVKCIYQSATTWSSAPQLRIPLADSSIARFSIEIDVEPNDRNNEYIFGYGTKGQVDTNVCYISKYNNNYELVYGIIGGTDSSTISDISRGVLKWKWTKSVSYPPYNQWNIIWKSLQTATASINNIHNVILTFLKINNGSSIPGYIVSLGKIYGVVIKDENSNVIMYLVPALNEDTGLAGLYDTVNNTFYGNVKSSGTVLYESL